MLPSLTIVGHRVTLGTLWHMGAKVFDGDRGVQEQTCEGVVGTCYTLVLRLMEYAVLL